MNEVVANRYQIIREIGHGGMADVFLAFDNVLKREVSLKILRGELAADPVSLLRFKREANSASALSHPNIVEIYDVGEDNGKQYIVMEYVNGKTLKHLLADRGALSVLEAITIMKQLVSAIGEAHHHSIIHRDIKSQNVLIQDDGTVKITDFGIALAQDSIQLTQTDSVMGSVHYLAPEIARGETATIQSDIYSLGIVFFELLCGNVPFHGETPIQVAMKHMNESLPSVRGFNFAIPQSVENIIIKACAKNRGYRYSSVEEMYKDIDECLEEKHLNDSKIVFENDDDNTISFSKINRNNFDKPKKSNNFLATGLGVSLIVFAIATLLMIFVLGSSAKPKTFKMIDLTGMTLEEAREIVEINGLVLNTKINYVTTVDNQIGTIVTTSPSPSVSVEKGTIVTLTICDANYYLMEDYTGKQYSEVRNALAGTRIKVSYEKVVDTNYEPGTIISQSILPDTLCDPSLTYSLVFEIANTPIFQIPNVIAHDINEAYQELTELGAVVELCPLDTSSLTQEELNKLKYNVVVQCNYPVYSYYTQTDDSTIILYFYEGQ